MSYVEITALNWTAAERLQHEIDPSVWPKPRPTAEQQAIIDAPLDSDLLVSASAGSGKTATMSERIVARLLAKQLDLDSVVVLTYTEAAAKNMRQAIVQQMRKCLAKEQDPERKQFLREQQDKLMRAQISTIHSFCQKLTREYGSFQKGVDEPSFISSKKILDSSLEQDLIREAIDLMLKEHYLAADERLAQKEANFFTRADEIQSDSGDAQLAEKWMTPQPFDGETGVFTRMVELLGSGRDDRKFREDMLALYRSLRAFPDYLSLFNEQIRKFELWGENFVSSELFLHLWGQLQKQVSILQYVCQKIRALLIPPPGEGVFYKNAKDSKEIAAIALCHDFLNRVEAIWIKVLQEDLPENIDQAPVAEAFREKLRSLTDFKQEIVLFYENFPSRSRMLQGKEIREKIDRYLVPLSASVFGVTRIKDQRSQLKTQINAAFLSRSIEEVEQEHRELLPCLKLYGRCLERLDAIYRELKNRQSAHDFSDIIHAAYQLVKQEDVYTLLRDRYLEFYIDEYQDTSAIQEAIFERLAHGRRFMVGDMKQSIYGFQDASPIYFREKERRFDQNEGGRLFYMNTNFRSSSQILSFVNRIFMTLMTEESAQIDYDERQMMRASERLKTDGIDTHVIFLPLKDREHSTEEEDEEEEQKDSSYIQKRIKKEEAKNVAYHQLAREILKRCGLSEEEAKLRLDAKDKPTFSLGKKKFAVLARSNNELDLARKVLERYGLPLGEALSDAEPLEIIAAREMSAWFFCLRNPLDDMAYAAYLLSDYLARPLTEDELLEIRTSKQLHVHFDPLGQNPKALENLALFDLAQAYIQEGEHSKLKEALQAANALLLRYRERLAYEPLARLTQAFIDETNYLYLIAARAEGERESKWIDQLIQSWSGQQNAWHSLNHFCERYEREPKSALVDQEKKPSQSGSDAICFYTYHGSKGLQFDHVFVLIKEDEAGKKNKEAILSFDDRHGLAVQYQNPRYFLSWPTLSWRVIFEQKQKKERAEKMRLYYVALTRAKESMTLICRVKRTKNEPCFENILEQNPLVELLKELSYSDLSELNLNPDFAKNLERIAFHEFMDKEKNFANLIWLALKRTKVEGIESVTSSGKIAFDSADVSVIDGEDLLSAVVKERMRQEMQEEWAAKRGLFSLNDWLQSLDERAHAEEAIPIFEGKMPAEAKGEESLLKSDLALLPSDFYQMKAESKWERNYANLPMKYSVSEIAQVGAEKHQWRKKELLSKKDEDELCFSESGLIEERYEAEERSELLGVDLAITELEPLMQELLLDAEDEARSSNAAELSLPLDFARQGTALHTLMRHLDFFEMPRVKDGPDPFLTEDFEVFFTEHIEKLERCAFLLPQEAMGLKEEIPDMVFFWCSELGQYLASIGRGEQFGKRLYREKNFTLMLPIEALYPDAKAFSETSAIQIQGTVDLYVDLGDELWLFDYKTDHATSDLNRRKEELKTRYARQLELYAQALSQATGKAVTRKTLIALKLGTLIEL